ncbi:hypothetical protein ACFXKC_12225 [Streptomyces sp. NPDC059340]|uniref:hypothetical protein n=1 Tax=Streptomyces sp. NPDC059340 TaxID=3346806 RepID=UPI00369F5BC7
MHAPSGIRPHGSAATSLAFSPARDHIVGLCGSDWHAWIYSTDSDPGLIVSGSSMTVQGQSSESGTVLFDPSKSRRLLQTTGSP